MILLKRSSRNRVAAAAALITLVALLVACAGGTPRSINAANTPSPGVASPAVTDPGSLVIESEPWKFEGKDGTLLRTPSYRIFTTSTKSSFTSRLPHFLELGLINYTSALGELPRPPSPMETYLLANRPQWARLTQRVMGADAEVYLKIQRGGFAANGKALLYDIGSRDTFAIAAHEGWHQYTQTTFHTPLPTSLEEGVASYMEGFRWGVRWGDGNDPDRPNFRPWANLERYNQLRTASANKSLMPLEVIMRSTPQELIGDDPDAALTYYAQVWALIHFLNEGEGGMYAAHLRDLLHDAATGELMTRIRKMYGQRAASAYASRRQGVDLLELYFGHSASDLDAPYREFIGQIVRVGSLQHVVAGESPMLNR